MDRYKEYFNYKIRTSAIKRDSFTVTLQAVVVNLGRAVWDTSDFAVGVLLLDPETKSVAWESRSKLPDCGVAMNQHCKVSVSIPAAYLAVQGSELLIDVVKEGAFWFKDIGVTPLTTCLSSSECDSEPSNDAEPPFRFFNCRIEDGIAKAELHYRSECCNAEYFLKSSTGTSIPLPCCSSQSKKVGMNYFQIPVPPDTHLSLSVVSSATGVVRTLELPHVVAQGSFSVDFHRSVVRKGRLLEMRAKLSYSGVTPLVVRSEFLHENILCLVVEDSNGSEVKRESICCPLSVLHAGETCELEEYISLHELPEGRYTICLEIFGVRSNTSEQFNIQKQVLTKIPNCDVLVVAPTLPRHLHESGGLRLYNLLKIISETADSVSFCCEEQLNAADPYLASTKECCSEVVSGVARLMAHSSKNFSYIVVSFYECAARHLALLREYYPQADIIVDSVDIHWVRVERGVQSGFLTHFPEEVAQEKADELAVYAKADSVWTVTENDAEALRAELPNVSCQVVSNIHTKSSSFQSGGAGDDILFVGNFLHLPNIAAVIRAIEIVNEFNSTQKCKRTLKIVGDKLPIKLQELCQTDHMQYLGFVEDLTPLYNSSRILLAPINFGSGIKGKVCHAICGGLPVLTSPLGVEGLDVEDGVEVLLAETNSQFVAALARIFSDELDLHVMKRRALPKVLELTSVERAREQIY